MSRNLTDNRPDTTMTVMELAIIACTQTRSPGSAYKQV